MELSDLAAYAREKYHIVEQHKWADFPGFSVLPEPQTGKWAALLMRQWDGETGGELQRCDIKCGRQCLAQIRAPWLTMPFRMKGQNWVGVILDRRTDPQVVYRLFDRAVVSIGQQRAYTVILEEMRGNTEGLYHDTVLPPRKAERADIREKRDLPEAGRTRTGPAGTAFGLTGSTETGFGGYFSTAIPQVPQKIRDMIRLYEYRGEAIEEKCRNFYRQGKFMEDYEDDVPWTGEYRRYFTTYHDLHLHQLRGYFTWRTAVRKGEFGPIATSLAYMYLYELLCGIGTASPEDSLRKMREFEKGFLDSGIGDSFMRRNLHRWMLDYAVLHAVPVETACLYEVPAIAERDLQMAVLKEPGEHSDEDIFAALCAFGNKKIAQSPVVTGHPEKGPCLFAALWRKLTAQYTGKQTETGKGTETETRYNAQWSSGSRASAAKAHCREEEAAGAGNPQGKRKTDLRLFQGADAAAAVSTGLEQEQEKQQEQEGGSAIFTACFGKRKSYPWKPLSNAIHWEEEQPLEAEYVLNPCRAYRCHGGEWTEERYENPSFARDLLEGLLHAADRGFRRYLKTGRYLRAKEEEAWAEPFIEAVIDADREAERAAAAAAEREAAMARITIDLTGLDRIRRDASITRDSLLTETELEETALEPEPTETVPEPGTGDPAAEPEAEGVSLESGSAETAENGIEGLDSLHTQILCTLLRGGPVDALLRENHLMPSLAADTINEVLYDEIGDNVIECDGDVMAIMEEYREDLEEMLV